MRKATAKTPRAPAASKATRPPMAREGRIDFRVSPETKDLLVRAAALRGSNLTAFVLESAQERAVALIERHDRLRLTDRDRDKFLRVLDNSPAPTAALRRAMAR